MSPLYVCVWTSICVVPYMADWVSHMRKREKERTMCAVSLLSVCVCCERQRGCLLMNRQVRHNKSTAGMSGHSDSVSHKFNVRLINSHERKVWNFWLVCATEIRITKAMTNTWQYLIVVMHLPSNYVLFYLIFFVNFISPNLICRILVQNSANYLF